MTYTTLAATCVVLAVVLDRWVARTRVTSTGDWWSAYAIIVFFQLLTNGWLTGRGIVRYSGDAILGSGEVRFVGGRVEHLRRPSGPEPSQILERRVRLEPSPELRQIGD